MGNWRGFTKIHILEADGFKLVHMGDLGTQLDGGQISRLFGADVCMICAGSATALPSQEAKRGAHRLESVEEFIKYFDAPEFIHRYDTDTFSLSEDMEPQVAVLKYLGPAAWTELAAPEKQPERRGFLRFLNRK